MEKWAAWKSYLTQGAIHWLMAFWIVLSMEALSRSNVNQTAFWTLHHLPVLLLNSALCGLLLGVVTALTNNLRISFIALLTLGLGVAYVSGLKLKMLGVPLLPSDLSLLHDAEGVVPLQSALKLSMILGALGSLLLGGSLAWAVTRKKSKARPLGRMVAAVAALGLLVLAYVNPAAGLTKLFRLDDLYWDQAQMVRTDGLLLSLVLNARGPALKPAMAMNLGSYAKPTAPLPAGQAVKPNIVVVLSESLWDPTKLPNVTFSEDPLPFIHSLQKKYSSGYMMSPVFGAGTSNVEMEVLTGMSARFIPQGTYPLLDHVKWGVDSLAAILHRQGYDTTAVSPWPWQMYGTDSFKYLGFSRVVPKEFMKPDVKGYYLADREVARNIINVADQARQKGTEPYFIYANTSENHFEFLPTKFPEHEITVQGVLTGDLKGTLESYAQGCLDADRMLQSLVQYFSKVQEPTIILWFGDHLPVLGEDHGVYKATGYLSGEDDPDVLNKLYRSPVLVWNNYLPARKDSLDMSAAFLSPYLLNLAGLQGTAFTDYLHNLSQRMPLLPPQNYWASMGVKPADLQQWQATEQDVLYGDRQTYGDLKDKVVDPNFTLAFGAPVLTRGTITRGMMSGATLTLTGEQLPPRSVVLLGDKPLATTWQNAQTLAAALPPDVVLSSPVDVKVRLLSDDGKRTIVESNVIQVTEK